MAILDVKNVKQYNTIRHNYLSAAEYIITCWTQLLDVYLDLKRVLELMNGSMLTGTSKE